MYCIQAEKENVMTHLIYCECDICYRYCEDGSESNINFRDKCPLGITCKSSNRIGFDSGNNAFVCSSRLSK